MSRAAKGSVYFSFLRLPVDPSHVMGLAVARHDWGVLGSSEQVWFILALPRSDFVLTIPTRVER